MKGFQSIMGEETSLARQLKKLAAPQTSILSFDKGRPSLLYKPQDAANYDRDKFFDHGCTGLDKLMIREAKFAAFQQTLFSENSKTFERSVQNKEANKKLDEAIADFLCTLSPYVTLYEASEALEWLIHRFHIHMFNVDDLIACVLPYHETKVFVNVLHLLDLRNPSGRWYWLKPFQNSNSPVDASVIIKHFNSDGGFRKFVCDLIPNILKVYGGDKEFASLSVISFSTLTAYHALQISRNITDSTLAVLLPYIVQGLKSEVPSYCSGTYMVLCAILMREKLEPSILKQLLIRITQCPVPSLLKESLEVILLVFQQQDIRILPKKVFSSLCSSKKVITHLKFVSETYCCEKFLQCVIKRAVPSAYKQELVRKLSKPGKALTFLLNTLNSVCLQKADVTLCLRLILNWCTKLNKKCRSNVGDVSVLKKVGKSLLKCLELRCPEHFDAAVECYFKKKAPKQNKCARTLLNSSVTSLQHELLPNSSMTLLLGVYHPLVSVRAHAVAILLEKVSSNKMTDSKFIRDSLLARLNDECPEVLLPILMSGKVLFSFLTKQQLFTSLHSVLQKNSEQKVQIWHPVKLEALKVMCSLWEMCSEDDPVQASIFSVILPYLLPLQNESLEYLSCILDSTLATKHPILGAVKEASLAFITVTKDGSQKLVDLSCKIIKSLLSAFDELEDYAKCEIVTLLVEKQSDMKLDCCYSFILALILQHLVRMNSNPCHQLKWVHCTLELFSNCLDSNKMLYCNENLPSGLDGTVKVSVKILKKKKIPVSVLSFGLQEIIKSLNIECFTEELAWWPDLTVESAMGSSYVVLLDLFQFLTKYMNVMGQDNDVFKMIFGTLIQTHFPDLKKMFWFLASLWSDYAKPNLVIKISAIKMAEALCIPPVPPLNWVFEKSCSVIPSLLVTISAQNQQIRRMALELLEKILLCDSSGFQSVRRFAANICQHSKEIGMDSNQLCQIVGHWLSSRAEILHGKQLESSDEFIILEWLQHMILDNNTPKVIKLNTLSLLQFVNSKEILSSLLPVLEKYLSQYKDKESDMVEAAIIQHLLNKFTVETAVLLDSEMSEAFVILSSALKLIVQRENCVNSAVHEMALKQVTKEFFMAIPSAAVQQKILGMLLDLYLSSVPSDLTSKINRTLRKLCVYASQLLKVLHEFEFASSKKTVKEMRRSRTPLLSSTSDGDFLENGPWKKIIVILEIIQDKKKINQKEILIPELFNFLSKTLEWENQASVEYVRQLVLSSIFNCCDELGISGLDETKFQVELVVQCIRVSDNPKTHHQSLLLLNLAATIFPDYVLNNIMSIFTFMGSSIIRQDNSYSFQVISQTIETIVPALLQASHQQKDSLQVIATVIRVFVDSLLHIPRHRQLPLFTKLITTLGPSDYLWLPLAQICGNYVVKEDSSIALKKGLMGPENNPILEFSFNLFQLFAPCTQVNACTELIRLLTTLPDKKNGDLYNRSGKENDAPKEPFDIAVHTDLQLQLYKFTVLHMVNTLLSSQNFIGQVSELEAKSHHKMEEQYKSLFEIVLQYLKHINQIDTPATDNDLLNATIILLYDLLNSVNALLPCDQFISFVLKLLKNRTTLVRSKTLEMLNAKMENHSSFFSEDKCELLLKLLRPVLKIVRQNTSAENNIVNDKDSDNVQNRQNALLSVHLICKIAGSKYPGKFEKVLKTIVEILSTDSAEYPLVVNALLCLAQLCKCLKAHVLPQLNMFMPKIISLLEESHAIEKNDYLALGAVTALQGLIEYLGAFMSCYIEPIVAHVCELASKFTGGKGKKEELEVKLQKLLELIAAEVPIRILLPAICNSYGNIVKKNKSAVSSLMFILRERISTINQSGLQEHCSEMKNFYILALGFRSENPTEPLPVVENVEESIIASVARLCLKLSESAFCSFFNLVKFWIRNSEESKDKVLTFYRLTHELTLTLKHFFVKRASMSTFVWHAASVLDANNTSKTEKPYFEKNCMSTVKSAQLLNYIMDTFTNCFLYDNKELVDKDFFNTFMQPLVDQIENNLGDGEVYKKRIEEHLATCIAHFAISVTDSSLWKQLNYQILLKSRHSSAQVRFAALQVLREVVKKMDTEYLTLLPESVPFLAELMEDESFEVEQQCQTVVAEMEQILGEELSKYF